MAFDVKYFWLNTKTILYLKNYFFYLALALVKRDPQILYI